MPVAVSTTLRIAVMPRFVWETIATARGIFATLVSGGAVEQVVITFRRIVTVIARTVRERLPWVNSA